MVQIYIETILNKEMEKQIQEQVINEAREIFSKSNNIKPLIRDCVKGCIKTCITEILQGADYKKFLRDKIIEEMGMGVKASK